MNKDQILRLLTEATGVDCADERMNAISIELQVDRVLALKLLEDLKNEYGDIVWDRSSTEERVTEAEVRHNQCFRLRSVLLGEEPEPRLSVEDFVKMGKGETPGT